MSLELIKCKSCGNDMPKLRLTQYGYDFCTNCSTVMPKVGRTLTLGEGDHTWNELEILDQETAKKLIELEMQHQNYKLDQNPLLDFNQDLTDDDVVDKLKSELRRVASDYDPDDVKYSRDVKGSPEQQEGDLIDYN
jgi:hypothetical protein